MGRYLLKRLAQLAPVLLLVSVIVQATLTLPSVILSEASLSFLGIGTPPPAPS
ncbi:MAG: hypothetical protein HGJ94_09605 [Desulfosarcina sp.]|nr:hypothetical protein [Desulfosarcina sp.]MBC2742197.1 hypothetical protein [Desulfosarcina sp.]MBC2765109.1 hypothetical protein [Desulfosarcina sp.]